MYTIYKVVGNRYIPTSYTSSNRRTINRITSMLNKASSYTYEYHTKAELKKIKKANKC